MATRKEGSSKNNDVASPPFYETVRDVTDSWMAVKMIPNYSLVAGELLFRKIFQIAPSALHLYSFGGNFEPNSEELYDSPAFKAHANGVVLMLDVAVNMLGPDLSPVTVALKDLGARHVPYGVLPVHYPIVGEALLDTLEKALGPKFTPKVKAGWVQLFDFVSKTMIIGAEEFIAKEQSSSSSQTTVINKSKQLSTQEKQKDESLCSTAAQVANAQGTNNEDLTDSTHSHSSEDQQQQEGNNEVVTVAAIKRSDSFRLPLVKVARLGITKLTKRIRNIAKEQQGRQNNARKNSDSGDGSNNSSASSQKEWCASTIASESPTLIDLNEMEAFDQINHEDFLQSNLVNAVDQSWLLIKTISNYEGVLGKKIFQRIFEQNPGLSDLYGYANDINMSSIIDVYSSDIFSKHAKSVVRTIDEVVNMLGPDLDPVAGMLMEIGATNASYGILPDHYAMVRDALMATLQETLGNHWTPAVSRGWDAIYSFVIMTMIRGALRSKERAKRLACGEETTTIVVGSMPQEIPQ